MADEDPGVLGNLPRSRPGRRSDKRGGSAGKATPAKRSAPKARAAKPASRQTAKSPSSRAKTAKPRAAAPKARAAQTPRPAPARERPAPPPPPVPSGSDPVGDAIRVAGKIAEVGLKTAGGLLKRLPGR